MAETSLDRIAERYVRLALRVGLHDPYLIDHYNGPLAWRPAAAGPDDSPAQLAAEGADIEGLVLTEAGTDRLTTLRIFWLAAHIRALRTKLRMLSGESLGFDEESLGLYGITAPALNLPALDAALTEIGAALPGPGGLAEKIEMLRARTVIPREKIPEVMRIAVDACRSRTAAALDLPAQESFTLEYVTAQPWSAYNWYKGNAVSLIQVNLDLPLHLTRVLHLAAHEGYPGHHVHHSMLEQRLLQQRGWVEYSVHPLFSPHAIIAEGVANTAERIVFPGDESAVFEREVLAPIAGIDPAALEPLKALRRALAKLKFGENEAARGFLERRMSEDEAVHWLATYALMTAERARQRLRFIERYRSYIITYNVGEGLVRDYLTRVCGSKPAAAERWKAFGELLCTPFTAETLQSSPPGHAAA